MFLTRGAIVFFTWILLNQISGSESLSGECARNWEVEVSRDLSVSWKGDANETAEVEVNVVPKEPSNIECQGWKGGRASFDQLEYPSRKTPCSNTAYNVTVDLICDGTWNATRELTVWTPPLAPSNVKAGDITVSSFKASWDSPPGDIFGYKVEVNGTTYDETKDLFLVVKDLRPNTLYSFKVSAQGRDWSDWSTDVFVKTKIDVPVPVLKKGAISNTSIDIYWDNPDARVTLLTVQWAQKDKATYEYMNTTTPKFKIENLVPYTIYSIKAAAWIEDEMGNWSSAISVQTAPGIPFKPRNLKEGKITSRSVEISWTEPQPPRGPILHYNIWCLQGKMKRSLKILQTNNTRYLLESLSPGRKYTIKVRAVTTAGEGEWSERDVKTLSEKPFPPVNVSALSETPNSLKVTWGTPEYVGKILQYTLWWKELDSNELRSDNTTELSYVIQSLKPYSNVSIEVNAWTTAGPGKTSDPIIVRTAAGVPSSPRDLAVASTSDKTIQVVWKEPEPFVGPIDKYTVKWKDEKNEVIDEGYTDKTSFLIESLKPFSNYTIMVQAETKAGPGDWSEPIVGTSDIGVPSSPRDVVVNNITDRSFLVEWLEPEPPVGPILKYSVKWVDVNNSLSGVETTDKSFILIENLNPYTIYTIFVRAETSTGPGVWTDPKKVRTAVGVPSSPRELKSSNITDTSIFLEWKDPAPFVGLIIRYHVQWTNMNSSRTENDSTVKSDFHIQELDSFTDYKISVQAETSAGRGDWSSIRRRTAVGIPNIPRNIQTTPTNVSIDIKWEEPDPFTGPIESYTISWRSSDVKGEDKSLTTNYVIRNLKPFTSYFVQIRATTSAGGSPWSNALEVKTKTGIPSIPRNVKEINVTTNSILLEWQDPSSVVGIIDRYWVTWRNMKNDSLKDAQTTETSFLIQQLNPFTNYSITVTAETCAGLGSSSDPVLVRTNIGVPSAPENVTTKNIGNTSIEMTWNEPQPNVGDILEYLIVWTDVKSGTSEATKTINLFLTIENLQPYTKYSIAISAKTQAGIGNSSEPLVVRTKSGVPLAPDSLQKVKVTNHSIEIKWEEPKIFKGPIISYTVRWGSDRTAETKQCQYVIQDLRPYYKYGISVRARTAAGFGVWSDPLNLQTDTGLPSTPQNLTVTHQTARSVSLMWFEPEFPNGPRLGYRLDWGVPGAKVSSIHLNDTLYEVTDLLPYTEYQFLVTANTTAGWGPSTSSIVTRTDVAVPSKAKIFSAKIENSSNFETKWKTEDPYPGPTQYELMVWKGKDSCSVDFKETLVTVLKGVKSREEWNVPSVDVVEDLQAYTIFYTQVILKTEAGTSTSDTSPMLMTPPKAPGPPTNVVADCEKKSTEAEVRWSVPENPNGKITEYLVEYGTEYLGYRETSVKVKDACEGQSVRLRGLRPEREYRIYVRARAQDVSDDGQRAALKEFCVLPAGVPPLGKSEHVTVESSGPHHLTITWNDVVFSDAMGSLVEYSVIVGSPGAVGLPENGVSHDAFPTWRNFSSGMSDLYQATPPDWNPFTNDQDGSDPLNCKILLDISQHKTLQCVLGLDDDCSSNASSSFCNGPLRPDTRYGVKLRAYTRGGYSETAPIFARTAAIPGSGLAGALVGAFFSLLLIGIIVTGVIVIRKRGGMPYVHKIIAPHLPNFKEPTTSPPQLDPVVELESYDHGRCINILNFSDHVRLMMSDSHLRFSEEFETLKLNSPKYNCASAEMDENRLKNRWMNIHPYDHSRVKLLPLGDEPESDFINANYIPGDTSLREYIATQGPLPHTVDDFWRMIWEQSSTMIVMLTQCVERGKVKCEQYWPSPGEAKHYGDIQVRSLSESMLTSYTIRLFHVQLGSHDRRIKQMHFTRWPDFGCPESPEDLINFVRAVRDHLPQIRPGPILVHCSAGVGRTGTFIAVDRLMQHLKHSNVVDIYSTVLELRHHRINMVQTEDQYIYIHLCVQQLVREITNPQEKDCEEAIYSNLGIDKETGF